MAPNRLARESSPYLRQHADNPVDWYPWGTEAFERASAEDKPVLLSIGYSTCHWCHVMERESFSDPEVARLLNATFVCVKVDREERPDIDNVYMRVCRMMTGGGGWPLTIIMTPDRRPFFAGTYLPRESRFGRLGLLEFIPRVAELWRERRLEVGRSAHRIAAILTEDEQAARPGPISTETLGAAAHQLARNYDARHGGFGTAPKFPTPHNLLFLLRRWRRTADEGARRMVGTTLAAMRAGGIWDHVGFGFHRYATDAAWGVPHFEKMLYDQAMLALAYLEGYQAVGDPLFAETARRIFTYVRRDLAAPGGGFVAAEDADSEGREGKFYLWTEAEIRAALPADVAELVCRTWSVTAAGNFVDPVEGERTGANILHRAFDPDAGVKYPLAADERERLEDARRILFAAREKRVRPFRDGKILADWNGLMAAALAVGARVLDEPAWAEAAAATLGFVRERMTGDDGRLRHCFMDGRATVTATVDDYAFVTWGCIELHQATFDPAWLELALELQRRLDGHYRDGEPGGYCFTPDDGEALLVRQTETADGAVPAGNSVALHNLLRLARLTGDTALFRRADDLMRALGGEVAAAPLAHTHFLAAADLALEPAAEVVITGQREAADTVALLDALRDGYRPEVVVHFRPAGEPAPGLPAYVADREPVNGGAAAYVCRDFVCRRAVSDPSEMLAELDRPPAEKKV